MSFVASTEDEDFSGSCAQQFFSYDVDLIKEEIQYYNDKEQSGDESVETDSGVHSAREWKAAPVPVAETNGIRRGTIVYTLPDRAITLKNLHKVELLRYRACGEQYILNDDRLVFHLLAFIDICEEGPSAHGDPPLFIERDDTVTISCAYKYKDDDYRSMYGEEHLINTAIPYFSTHVALREISDFVDFLDSNKNSPVFWKVFLNYIREFFADYRNAMMNLRRIKRLSVAGLLSHTAPFRETVLLLHSLVFMWFEIPKFDWIHVELAWNNLFVMMHDRAAWSDAEAAVVIRLQRAYQGVFLRIMDHIYSFGQVPTNWEKHFIFYNDPADPELLITRSHPSYNSMLWSDELLFTVLRGARARVRLGVKLDVEPVFSNAFRVELESHKFSDNEEFVTFHNFRSAFESTAMRLTHELSSELLSSIRTAGLIEHWLDMKEVTCGRVAQYFAASVYGCNSDLSKIGTLDVQELYRTALLRGGVSPSRAMMWRLPRGAVSETDYLVQCKLERPLSYVFNKTLVLATNGCMDNLFKIFRVVELLASVSSERKSVEDCKQIAEDRNVALRRVRHMTFIVSKVLNLVSIIKELFIEKVMSIFDRYTEALEAAVNVEMVEDILNQAEMDFQALIVRTDIRKPFHEIVDILKSLAEEIRLKSVSNDITLDSLIRWHKTTVRSIEFLALVGKAMPVDSVFHALYVRLNYNRDNVRYPSTSED